MPKLFSPGFPLRLCLGSLEHCSDCTAGFLSLPLKAREVALVNQRVGGAYCRFQARWLQWLLFPRSFRVYSKTTGTRAFYLRLVPNLAHRVQPSGTLTTSRRHLEKASLCLLHRRFYSVAHWPVLVMVRIGTWIPDLLPKCSSRLLIMNNSCLHLIACTFPEAAQHTSLELDLFTTLLPYSG